MNMQKNDIKIIITQDGQLTKILKKLFQIEKLLSLLAIWIQLTIKN